MKYNGRTITSNKKKADLFVQHCTNISRHNFIKEERDLHRTIKKLTSVDNEYNRDFTLAELKKAIAKMRRKGAQSPDDIPPTFLKEIGPKVHFVPLEIFNMTFRTSCCPKIWRLATILPLPKAGKPASNLNSFRPISLTSCVSKLFDRMLAERLYHLEETNGLFNHKQAGFTKGRGCEDQINRIIY